MSQKIIVLVIIGILLVSLFDPIIFSITVIIILPSIIILLKTGVLEDIIRFVKAKKIKREDVLLETNQEIGIFSHFNQGQKQVLIIFPRLTKDGDVEYSSLWKNLLRVTVHNLEKAKNKSENFVLMQQLVAPVREHLQIEEDISQLQQQEEKIERLLKLVSQSDLYSHQKELYDRALSQVQEMIDKASNLERVYLRLIKEVLIEKELSSYDPNQIVDNHMAMDSQYKIIKEEYQQLKDTATAYSELLQSDKL